MKSVTGAKKVKKKCARCGHVAYVTMAQRKCYQPKFGKGSYACWGDLETVVRKPRAKQTLKEANIQMSKTPQERAAEKLVVVRKHLHAANEILHTTAMKLGAVAAKIRELEREAARLERRTRMTEEEIEAERQQMAERAKLRGQHVRRGIKLGGT